MMHYTAHGAVSYLALHLGLAKLWGRGEAGRSQACFAPYGLLEAAGLASLAGPLPAPVAGLGGPFASDCGPVAEQLPNGAAPVSHTGGEA